MLVPEQYGNESKSRETDDPQTRASEKETQNDNHAQVEESRNPERPRDSKPFRDGVQPLLAIELKILTGIDNVETCDPQRHGEPEYQGRRRNFPANSAPC